MTFGGFTAAAHAALGFAAACWIAISATAAPLDSVPAEPRSMLNAGEATYLALTRSEMRSQMAAGKLDDAARTL